MYTCCCTCCKIEHVVFQLKSNSQSLFNCSQLSYLPRFFTNFNYTFYKSHWNWQQTEQKRSILFAKPISLKVGISLLKTHFRMSLYAAKNSLVKTQNYQENEFWRLVEYTWYNVFMPPNNWSDHILPKFCNIFVRNRRKNNFDPFYPFMFSFALLQTLCKVEIHCKSQQIFSLPPVEGLHSSCLLLISNIHVHITCQS